MWRVITPGSHPKLLTTVVLLPAEGGSPVRHISAEGQDWSLTEVSDLMIRILGETLPAAGADQGVISPDVQNIALL